jgi:hypothetical protein
LETFWKRQQNPPQNTTFPGFQIPLGTGNVDLERSTFPDTYLETFWKHLETSSFQSISTAKNSVSRPSLTRSICSLSISPLIASAGCSELHELLSGSAASVDQVGQQHVLVLL